MVALVHRRMFVNVHLDTVEAYVTLRLVLSHVSTVIVHPRKRVRAKLDGWEVAVIRVRKRSKIFLRSWFDFCD